MSSSKILVVAVAAGSLGSPLFAQTTYRYEFGQGLASAEDVAVYRDCGAGAEYVFVADPVLERVVRYDGDGSDDPPIAVSAASFWNGPYAVATDDSPRSPNLGQVYTVQDDGLGWGLLMAYRDGDLGDPTVISVKWEEGAVEHNLDTPRGVAVDLDGNVYIADPGAGRVVKVAAADAAWLGAASHEVEAQAVFDTLWASPQDVSVDQLGRMHVPHPCGCLAVFHPDGTLFGTGAILASGCTGVDAKDDHASSRTAASEVLTYAWDIPDEEHELVEAFGGAELSDPRGLEFEKLPRPFLGGFRCEDRLFVADGSAARVLVFGEDHLSTPRPADAVAHWRFETFGPTTPDSAGPNTMTLSVAGGWPRPERGRVRCGLGFRGASGKGVVADHPSLHFGEGDLTLETWVRTQDATGQNIFLEKRGFTNGFAAFVQDGHLGVQLLSGGASEDFAPAIPGTFVADGKWHHVAITVLRTLPGSKRTTLYVDGVTKVIDWTPLLGDLDNDWELWVGLTHGGLSAFDGALDELTLYDRALSPVEVKKIYEAACAGKHAPLVDDPVHYCAAGVSSGGCIPAIDFVGVPSAKAGSGFELLATGVDEGAFGVLLYGLAGPGFTPYRGGALCLEGPARRTPVVAASGQGACQGVLRLDFNAWMAADPDLVPGTGVWAQWWYREPVAAGPAGLQRLPTVLTDALHFQVQ